MKNSKKGFTLVEIMIVVVIIGLLAAMAIPAFNKVRQTSQNKAITNNLRQMASAGQQYILENGTTQVSYSDLAGDYFAAIQAVSGETYVLTILEDGGVLITTTTGDDVVKYTY